jgi:hypothetical protein
MISLRSLPTYAALGALLLAAPAAAFQAQETNTVGPEEIRNFSLPGTRPAQPEPEPTIAPVTPPVAQPQPPVATPTPVSTPPTPTPSPAARAPETRAPTAAPPRTQPQDLQEALPPAPATPEPEVAAPLPQGAPVAEQPATAEPQPQTESGFPWLYLLLGAGIVGLGLFGWRRFRTVGTDAPAESFALAKAAPSPQPEPLPQAVPAAAAAPAAAGASGEIGIVMRPWLELEFRPDRATATADGAGVQYEVIIRNVGNAPARNVRLAARMFNAGPELDQEIAAFFARGVDGRGAAPLTILPRTEVKINSVVSMPRAEMREIKVQGRSLFIPTVAFNLLYAWGRDKTGQTCSSHIVGREPETPSQKMAPFRLDLGPRIYRQVGQRPSQLARAV